MQPAALSGGLGQVYPQLSFKPNLQRTGKILTVFLNEKVLCVPRSLMSCSGSGFASIGNLERWPYTT